MDGGSCSGKGIIDIVYINKEIILDFKWILFEFGYFGKGECGVVVKSLIFEV